MTRRSLIDFLSGPWFHMALLLIWLGLAIPGMTTWRESLTWINFQSLYAILATHLGGWVAAKAKESADQSNGTP